MNTYRPKICLYLEYRRLWGGFLYKKIGTGLLSSYENQKKMLDALSIEYTEEWDPSCDILQINTPWLYSLYLIRKAKKRGKKIIIWSHVTAEDIQGVFRFSFLLSKIARKYLRYAYGLADVVFSPSQYTKSLLLAYGIPAGRIIVMSNGVDTERFKKNIQLRNQTRAAYALESVTAGIVALAIPRKGISTFLNLARKFPSLQFMWFGKIYNQLVAPPLPQNIPANARFSGYVDDVVGAFNALDIFLFPSYEENQGMVILEAGSVGLPVLVRDIPVYEGWLLDGVNCLKAGSEEEFEIKLSALSEDAELRERLGNALKQTVEKDHSVAVLSARTKAVYNSLIHS